MVLVVRLPKKAVFKWVFCGQACLRSLGSYQACGSDHSPDAARAISLLLHPHFCLVIRTLLVPPSLSPLLLRFAPLVGFLTTFLFLLIQHPVFALLLFQPQRSTYIPICGAHLLWAPDRPESERCSLLSLEGRQIKGISKALYAGAI